MVGISDRKKALRARLEKVLETYHNCLIVSATNIGSNQMQQIRIALRGKAVLLMGKNTMIRKVVREYSQEHNPKLAALLPFVVGNVGFIFTNGNLSEIRRAVEDNKVPAAARVGTIAPGDCFIPAGPTGLDPGQTAFFQALQIATKIVKGAVEIINEVHLLKKGDKVSASAVSLLSKLDIKPFFYNMQVQRVYEDGTVYDVAILDMTPDDLMRRFFNGVNKLSALSLAIGQPNLATLPHSFARAFKKMLALAVTTDLDFKEAKPYKEYLADPAAFAAKHGGGAAAAPAGGAAPAKAEKKEEKKKEEESDEDIGLGGGLFGDD